MLGKDTKKGPQVMDFWTGFVKRANLVQAAEAGTAKVIGKLKGLAKKTEPQVLNYAEMHAADLAKKRARAEAAGGVMDYSNRKAGPKFTPAPQPPSLPKQPDPEAWSRINQQRRAKSLEQERTGIIR